MPAPTSPQTMRAADWMTLGGLSVIWGGSFLFIGIAVKELPALTLVGSRVLIAALLLLAAARLMRAAIPWGRWRDFALMALFGNALPFTLISWGQHHIPSGLASILNATTPLMTVLVLRLAGPRDPIGPARLGGLILGFLGVCVLIAPKLSGGLSGSVAGGIAVLLAALCYGLQGLWSRRFGSVEPVATAAGTLSFATLEIVPLALLLDRPWSLAPGPASVGAVLALASLCTAFAYLLFYRIIRQAGPTNASLVTFLVPPSAILMGTLILHERLDWAAFAGMALIFAGLAVIDGRLLRRIRPIQVA
ncbi:DMT family transporter [Oleisolibacter albus]|uniref:DMT family transporter n=1 Tax=Oleisolibacter albus TaxID=2171757 RepID=UPI001EFDF3C6|nr:DMT family transporter [Oleisolibacter albus]